MSISLLSSISGTPAENWKDAVVQIIKKMIAEGKTVNWDTIDDAIVQNNKVEQAKQILARKELAGGEFYQLVLAAI